MGNRQLLAGILFAVVGAEVFAVQPGFVQGLVAHGGFTDKQAGDLAGLEMVGYASTTILMVFLSRRINWRLLTIFSVAMAVVGNLASTLTSDFWLFGITRVVVGIGSGGMTAIGFATVSLTSRPDRNFGVMITTVLVYAALVMVLMPSIYDLAGLNGILFVFAAFAAASIPFVRYVPTSGAQQGPIERDAVQLERPWIVTALAAMFCYFLAQGVVWAYLFLIGTGDGASEQSVANGLTLSQFTGIAGAMTAAIVGIRFGRLPFLTLGILCAVLPLIAFLIVKQTPFNYLLAVLAYNFGYNLIHPFLLGTIASIDKTGRVIFYAVALQESGLAVGPFIAARVIDEGKYDSISWLGAVLFVAAWLLIILPVMKHDRVLATEKTVAV